MKPFKSGLKLAEFLLKFAVVTFVILFFYSDIREFQFKTKDFYIALGIVVFCVLLFIGNFSSKQGLTVISGLGLTLLCIAKMFYVFSGSVNIFFIQIFLLATIGFYYLCKGNQ